jgi:hypothetical protein
VAVPLFGIAVGGVDEFAKLGFVLFQFSQGDNVDEYIVLLLE